MPVCLICTIFCTGLLAQTQPAQTGEKDVADVLKRIFRKKTDSTKAVSKGSFAILPVLGYNPSFGFSIGAKVSGGRQFGNPSVTGYSIFSAEAFYSTKNILMLQVKHNVFVPGNKVNWQGHWQIAKMGIVDYGIGTGDKNYQSRSFSLFDLPLRNSDSSFPVQYTYIRLTEKMYRQVKPQFYAGAGLSLDIYRNINDEKKQILFSTPHNRYSKRNGFNADKYSANGLLFALQYNTREHPVRSYGGVYADLTFRFNQQWLGSTENAAQVLFDFRKYIGLSKQNPSMILAFWHWSSFLLSGKIPYLQLPSTASDTYARSGRGYTLGRFKGPSYAYFESELRFPVTKNKLISGVCFLNVQTASTDLGRKVFQFWEPGGGAGLRILFQKASRTALCIDYAAGKYGSQGLFFGLTEAF